MPATLNMAMTEAAAGGHSEIIRLVLDISPDIESLFDGDWRAIGAAAWSGHLVAVKMLMDCAASVDFGSARGWSPLRSAADQRHLHVVLYLLERGRSANAADLDGMVPVTSATTAHAIVSGRGHTDIVRFLEEEAVDPKCVSPTGNALCCATFNGHVDVVRHLADAKAYMQMRRMKSVIRL